jgi:DNA-binding response OmpR family regulator
VQLTPKEYDLLFFLSQNPNKAFSRETLLNEVWGYDFTGSDRTVDTHIKTCVKTSSRTIPSSLPSGVLATNL